MKLKNLILSLLAFAFCGLAEAQAGTAAISWDPVTTECGGATITDLAGYYVHWGTATVPNSTQPPAGYPSKSALLTGTSYTITGLADCTNFFAAVSAQDTSGNYSWCGAPLKGYSNEISGYPRVTLATASPSSLTRGRTVTVTITGTNFQPGGVTSTNTGIMWGTPTVVGCNSITVSATVASNAALGSSDIEYKRTGDSVFGVGTALVSVVADTTTPVNPGNFIRTDKK